MSSAWLLTCFGDTGQLPTENHGPPLEGLIHS